MLSVHGTGCCAPRLAAASISANQGATLGWGEQSEPQHSKPIPARQTHEKTRQIRFWRVFVLVGSSPSSLCQWRPRRAKKRLKWALGERGVLPDDVGVFAARRGYSRTVTWPLNIVAEESVSRLLSSDIRN